MEWLPLYPPDAFYWRIVGLSPMGGEEGEH
ncbi:hypothetical protein IWQ55_006552, partial [Labrenzia sp. EL_208]|nr:hypothetical protein [Labrenzia sp. EL_208]